MTHSTGVHNTVPLKEAVQWWRMVCSTLFGVLITGAAAWLVFGQDKITQTQAESLMEKYSPYVRDRSMITQTLSDLKTADVAMTAKVESMTTEVARANARLEVVIKSLDELHRDRARAEAEKKKNDGH